MPERIVRIVGDHAADVAAGISGSAAVISWITVANDILQLGATAIAIVAGLYAVKWHHFRLKQGRATLDKELRKKVIDTTIKETRDETKSE